MDGFGRLEIKTLADRAFEQIEAAIMRGELRPGARVSDFALARQLGISRGPVREAIQRLEGRNLISRVPHVGASVVAPSWDDLIEIFIVREALEGMACRLAAARMTDEELDTLGAPLAREGGAAAGAMGSEMAVDFHYRIARGSRNERLGHLIADELYYLGRVFRYLTGAVPGRAHEAYDEHQAIAAMIRLRDGDAAERLMQEHIARGRAILEERSRAGAPLEPVGQP